VLHVLFQLGRNRYALPARDVEEIIPLLAVSPLAGAPRGIAGMVNYRGDAVPVVDLAVLLLGRPAREQISTRLLILRYRAWQGKERRLGCIAEQATEILRCEPEEFRPLGVELAETAFLGPVRPDAGGLLQLISVDDLLSRQVRDALFREPLS
jgi:chemotaxis-related protein WspB